MRRLVAVTFLAATLAAMGQNAVQANQEFRYSLPIKLFVSGPESAESDLTSALLRELESIPGVHTVVMGLTTERMSLRVVAIKNSGIIAASVLVTTPAFSREDGTSTLSCAVKCINLTPATAEQVLLGHVYVSKHELLTHTDADIQGLARRIVAAVHTDVIQNDRETQYFLWNRDNNPNRPAK